MNLYTCMQTHSTCYKGTKTMKVKGILWHSTGCNNPNIKRYVQPYEGDANYNDAIAKLGKNTAHNDWNHIARQAGLNAWIGKFADGSVGTCQSMPWDYRPWGCGSGAKGSCNNGWIQFEICEDNLKNKDYAEKVWNEAIDLSVYLCKMYGLNPLGYATCGSASNVPVITCHNDSYKYGVGCNHSDINHWFPKILGKNMDNARQEIYAKLGGAIPTPTPTPTPAPTPTPTTRVSVSCSLPMLKVGSKGKAVKVWQTIVGTTADGDYGNNTKNATIALQKSAKIGQDGIVGKDTWTVGLNSLQ